jgi:glycopeptide antibiotics resistance protein
MILLRFWKPLIIGAAIIFLCLIPSNKLQKLDVLEFDYTDLLAHLIMFLVFSAVLFKDLQRFSGLNRKGSLLIIALSVNFGLAFSTETLQYVLAFLNRTANIFDLLFDGLGAVLGIIAAKATRRKPDPGF